MTANEHGEPYTGVLFPANWAERMNRAEHEALYKMQRQSEPIAEALPFPTRPMMFSFPSPKNAEQRQHNEVARAVNNRDACIPVRGLYIKTES